MRAKRLGAVALVALFFYVLVPQVWADKGEKRIQFGVFDNAPTDELVSAGQTSELDDAIWYQASFEYMVTNLIGVEPAISSAKSDVMVKEAGFPDLELGQIDFFTLTANVNFHLLRDKRTDLFVGPTIGYTFWGDLESNVFLQEFSADGEFVYGFNVGLNVPFGDSRWGFVGGIDYLFSDLTLEGSTEDVGVNPTRVKVGASYKF